MLQRHEDGLRPQIVPGTVKPSKNDGMFVIKTGRHRLLAISDLNQMLLKQDPKTKDSDLFHFIAIVDKADSPENELLDSYDENEFRVQSTVFDKADVITRLMERGMTQTDIAKRLGISEGRVSQIKNAANTPKKYRKLVEDGILEEEAVIEMMSLTKDRAHLRDELIEMAIKFKREEDAILQKMGDVEEEEEAAEGEAEEEGDDKGKKKSPTHAPKKKAKAGKKATGKSHVKRAAKEKGLTDKGSKMTVRSFYATCEAVGKDKENPIPTSAKALLGKIEELLDGDISVTQFRNALLKCCKDDAQFVKKPAA
jgi:predicted transcriptional regulator